MKFQGKLTRHGRWWLAGVPMLEAVTQGRSRKEALAMIGDWLETMIDRRGFAAEVVARTGNAFEIGGTDTAALIALLLRRRRQAAGVSLREVASRLGVGSRNHATSEVKLSLRSRSWTR
jgi:hypothetical protein